MSANHGHGHDETPAAAHRAPGLVDFFFGRVPPGTHGGLKQYGVLAIFLAVITLIEFLIIVPENLQGSSIVLAPLIILSVIKFFCVVAFFMHLKFEHRLLWQIFVAGLILGLVVAVSLVLLFGVFRPTPRDFTEGRAAPFKHHAPGDDTEHYEPLVVPTPAPPGAIATSGGNASAAAGDNPGLALFTGIGGCAACHTIDGISTSILGPPLDGIATAAANRIDGYSAAEYIRESILEPDAHTAGTADGLAQDYQAGLMMATMVSLLPSLQEADADGVTGIDHLVDYLLTLQ